MTLKTQKTDASVQAFVESIADEQRRDDCQQLLKIMENALKAEPKMWGDSIVGFGELGERR